MLWNFGESDPQTTLPNWQQQHNFFFFSFHNEGDSSGLGGKEGLPGNKALESPTHRWTCTDKHSCMQSQTRSWILGCKMEVWRTEAHTLT